MSELGPSPLAAREANLSVEQARAAIAARLSPIDARETVPLAHALGRVLADDVISPIDVPAHDNSAMDGYAFAGNALRAEAPLELRAVATVMAGAPFAGSVLPGQCVRIMTGAVMPPGADTVVIQEVVKKEGDRVTIPPGQKKAQNVRYAGEDLAIGKAVLKSGKLLKPADIVALKTLFTSFGSAAGER